MRFLRRLRAGLIFGEKSGKYLRYALGELVLVVIGILIALQINNWNQKRIEQQRVAEFASALVADLLRDLQMVQPIRVEMERLRDMVDGLADYVRSTPVDELRNLHLAYLVSEPYYRPYSWSRTTLEQMKSSGVFRQIQNRELAAKISAYDAFTRHLEEDYAFDREVGGKAYALARDIVDLNYPGIKNLLSIQQLSVHGIPFSFPDHHLAAAFPDDDRPLLNADPVRLGAMVNAYLELNGYYCLLPRLEIELPKLEKDIRELVADLREEYGGD